MRDAFAERIARHRANPVTDPPKTPNHWTKQELHVLDNAIAALQEAG